MDVQASSSLVRHYLEDYGSRRELQSAQDLYSAYPALPLLSGHSNTRYAYRPSVEHSGKSGSARKNSQFKHSQYLRLNRPDTANKRRTYSVLYRHDGFDRRFRY